MRFLSICSGIEAASVAFHPLGWEALAFAEIEPFPCSLLAHHYPQVPNLGDLTRWREWSPELLAQAEVLCGGTPCQAFSWAGLRGSLSDERGNLTLTFCHLFDEIDRQRHLHGRSPAVCLWENVPGVLNTDDNAFGHFLARLAGEDVPLTPPGGRWSDAGYVRGPTRAIAWRSLDAQYFGLAQRRDRVFVVASADPAFDPAAVLFEFAGLRRDSAPCRGEGKGTSCGFETGPSGGQFTNVAPTLDTRCKDGPIRNQLGLSLGVAERMTNEGVPEVANCLTRRMHKGMNSTLDEGQTPIVEVCEPLPFDTTQITSAANRSHPKAGDPCHPMSAQAHPPAGAFAIQERAVSENPNANLRAGSGGSSRSYVAAVEGAEAISFKPRHYRGERKDGAASDICGPLTANAEFAGDCSPHVACQELVAFSARERGDDGRGYARPPQVFDGAVGALDTMKPHCVALSESPSLKVSPSGSQWRVRRLTPEECEMLQGFPVGYTLIPGTSSKKRKAEDLSDTIDYLISLGVPAAEATMLAHSPDGPRYKALGNSWAVPVARWIARRIERQFQVPSFKLEPPSNPSSPS